MKFNPTPQELGDILSLLLEPIQIPFLTKVICKFGTSTPFTGQSAQAIAQTKRRLFISVCKTLDQLRKELKTIQHPTPHEIFVYHECSPNNPPRFFYSIFKFWED